MLVMAMVVALHMQCLEEGQLEGFTLSSYIINLASEHTYNFTLIEPITGKRRRHHN